MRQLDEGRLAVPTSADTCRSPRPPAEARRRRAPPVADQAGRTAAVGADAAVEQELLDRFGPAGVRLATDLIRSGRAPTTAALAVELTRHSGLPRLLEQIEARFGAAGRRG